MKQYAGWEAPLFSFWSPSFYQDVGKRWTGVGYLYLFLLVGVISGIVAWRTQMTMVPVVEQQSDNFIEQMPGLKIKSGKLSIDKPSPYTFTIPSGGKSESARPVVIIFDTRPKPVDLKEYTNVLLVTENTLVVKQEFQTKQYDLSQINDFAFDKGNVKQTVKSFLHWLGLLIFAIQLFFGFLLCIFQTLLYALLGRIFAKSGLVDLGYGTLVKLSAVALTPVLILDLLFKLMSIQVPYWGLISIVVALGYLYFAIDANKTAAI